MDVGTKSSIFTSNIVRLDMIIKCKRAKDQSDQNIEEPPHELITVRYNLKLFMLCYMFLLLHFILHFITLTLTLTLTLSFTEVT